MLRLCYIANDANLFFASLSEMCSFSNSDHELLSLFPCVSDSENIDCSLI